MGIQKVVVVDGNNLIVRIDRAKVRQEPDEQAALSFEAERDVVLELADPAVLARHAGGAHEQLVAGVAAAVAMHVFGHPLAQRRVVRGGSAGRGHALIVCGGGPPDSDSPG